MRDLRGIVSSLPARQGSAEMSVYDFIICNNPNKREAPYDRNNLL